MKFLIASFAFGCCLLSVTAGATPIKDLGKSHSQQQGGPVVTGDLLLPNGKAFRGNTTNPPFLDDSWKNSDKGEGGNVVLVGNAGGGGSPAPVPEPATMLLTGVGIAGAGLVRRLRKK